MAADIRHKPAAPGADLPVGYDVPGRFREEQPRPQLPGQEFLRPQGRCAQVGEQQPAVDLEP